MTKLALRSVPTLLLAAALTVSSLTGCAAFKKKGQQAGADGDFVSGTPLADRQEGVSFTGSNVDRSRFSPVYFGFDSYSIEGNERGKLDQIADFMQANSSMIIVAGFTDERGTEEYNRGLGEKRALAVREYLISRGANSGKLQTVSFGEEMPADSGGGDSAWAKNRRAEFGVVR
jgi:peptidoglycan-associated lipoprotein